jgi:hypothetical protein
MSVPFSTSSDWADRVRRLAAAPEKWPMTFVTGAERTDWSREPGGCNDRLERVESPSGGDLPVGLGQ